METLRHYTTARIVMRDESDRLLMAIRPLTSKQRPGDADFFGGMVDNGEEPISAAARELFEETGIKVKVADLEELHQETNQDGNKRFRREYFVCRNLVTLSQINVMPEHIGLVCVSPETALSLTEFGPHQRAIQNLQ